MVTVGDAIRIAITGDGAQAISEFKKVGASADANLKKADGSGKSLSNTLTKTGVIAATSGIAIGVGLFKAAQAAGDWDTANQKLNNTIHNQPQLAGASSSAFLKQAEALQQTTTSSRTATVTTQALLGTFGLTQQKILELTPLVIDLSQKFGIDTVAAAKAVGKAIDGNSAGLRRFGVMIKVGKDEGKNFTTVLDGVNKAAGGTSVAIGKTFNGQLEILKNTLTETEQNIGQGAIPVIRTLASIVGGAARGFSTLDEHTGGAVGTIAAWGAAALIAGGAASVVVGQVMKMGTTFTTLKGTLTGTTAAETEATVATGALGAAEATTATETAALGTAAVATTAEIGTLSSALGGAGLLGILSKVGVGAAGVGIVLGGMWDTKTDKGVTKHLQDINSVNDEYKKLRKEGVPAGEAAKRAITDLGKASSTTKTSVHDLTSQLEDQGTAASVDANHLYDIVGATDKLHTAMGTATTSVLDAKDAALGALGAQADYNAAVKQYGPNSAQAQLAAEALTRAQVGLTGAQDTARQAALDAAKAIAGGSTKTYAFVAALRAQKAEYPELAAWIDVYLGKLNLIPAFKNTQVTINGQKVNVGTGPGGPTYTLPGGKVIKKEGGWVPGAKDQPVDAILHGGEFVVSNEMLAGRKAIPSGLGGSRSGGSGGPTIHIENVTVVANSPREMFDQLARGAALGHRIPVAALP